jgi:hypothetical protein
VATYNVEGRRLTIPEATERLIDTLSPDTAARARMVILIGRYYGIPFVIRPLGARRTLEEQRPLLAGGQSRTLASKHLTGRAFDLDVEGWGRDALPRGLWPIVGQIGQSVGLQQPFPGWDPAHLEW